MRFRNKQTNNIIIAKQEFIDSLQDASDYELILEPTKTIEDLKLEKIKALHNKYQDEYDAYLSQYPQREVDTFATKQKEATAYIIDNTTPTPSIDAMVNNDHMAKVELINAIMTKVQYLAQQEGEMIAKRDLIKAATTEAELEGIVI